MDCHDVRDTEGPLEKEAGRHARSYSAILISRCGLAFGVGAAFLTFDHLPGVGYSLTFLGLLVLLLWLSRCLGRPPKRSNAWLAIPIALLSVTVSVRSSLSVTEANITALLALCGLLVVSWDRFSSLQLAIFGWLFAPFRAACNALARPFRVLWDAGTGLEAGRTVALVHAMASGVVLASPFFIVFALLFISADVVFAAAVASTWKSIDVPWTAASAAYGLVASWIGVGAIDLAIGHELRPRWAYHPRPWSLLPFDRLAEKRPGLSIGTTGVALGILLALFSTFVFFQIRYLFLPADQLGYTFERITYSEYAREGFFQLLAVATVVVLLASALEAFTRRVTPRDHWIFNTLVLALTFETFVIVLSSFRRLQLYGFEHSFTPLRFYSHSFTVFIAVVLVLLAVSVCVRRPQLLSVGTLFSGLIYIAGLNIVNPDAFIASANFDHSRVYVKPLDLRNFVQLSEDAVPTILSRLDELGPADRRSVEQLLYVRFASDESLRYGQSWQELHLGRREAKSLLAASQTAFAASCEGAASMGLPAHTISDLARLQRQLEVGEALC